MHHVIVLNQNPQLKFLFNIEISKHQTMIKIPNHIEELKSYHPGKSIEEYRSEFGFKKTAILWNNENNLGVPKMAVEAMKNALDGVNVYPDSLSEDLRTSIAKLNRVEVNQVTVENGSESILSNMFKAFVEPGEELLTTEGTFVAVYIWAKSSNVTAQLVPLRKNFSLDLDGIAAKITDKTKIVYLSNPNNPTGTMFNKGELKSFLDKVPNHVIVVVDEAYFEYATSLRSDYPDSTRLNHPQVITLRTFSKAYGLAGVRLGYAIGPFRLIEALNKVKMTFAPSGVTQAAGIGALNDLAFLQQSLRINESGLQLLKNCFEELGIFYATPAANFVMIDLKSAEKAEELTLDLLQKGIFVRWLRAFGLPNCVRVSVGLPEENEHFVETLKSIWR